mgnify:CR=1 FL=1
MKTKIFLIFLFLINFYVNAQNYCLRFFGNGVDDIDRVKIQINDPEKKADVGFDFTIEFQIKALLENNPLGDQAQEGENDDWTKGHIIIDRDIFNQGDYGDYGISLANGKIAFGVNNGTNSYTLIGNTFVADGNWKHIAVTRNSTTGQISIFVNGSIDKTASTNVTGDISYRNDRTPNYPNEPFIVVGAEKHDYDNSQYPSLNGFIDELRISDTIRYNSDYTPVSVFEDDEHTMALYHFDEGQENIVNDFAFISGNNSIGIINFGGNPLGPVWILNDIVELKDYKNTHFSIFPNPSNGLLSIVSNHKYDKNGIVKIYCIENKLIKILKLNLNEKIDLSYLNSGVYVLELITNEKNEFHKIILY